MTIQIQNLMQYDLFGNPDNPCDVKYIDTPIQGHLVQVSLNMPVEISHDDIKKRLVHILAKNLIDKKLISFTKITDPMHQNTTFYARGFLVSDENVRLIRTLVE